MHLNDRLFDTTEIALSAASLYRPICEENTVLIALLFPFFISMKLKEAYFIIKKGLCKRLNLLTNEDVHFQRSALYVLLVKTIAIKAQPYLFHKRLDH
jgi:hypothetical protein